MTTRIVNTDLVQTADDTSAATISSANYNFFLTAQTSLYATGSDTGVAHCDGLLITSSANFASAHIAGTVFGTSYGIEVQGHNASIVVSGDVLNGIHFADVSGGNVHVTGTGYVDSIFEAGSNQSVENAGEVGQIANGGDLGFIVNSGTVDGSISISGDGSQIQNSGYAISLSAAYGAGQERIYNSGTVGLNVFIGYNDAGSVINVRNSGDLQRGINERTDFGATVNVYNTGTIGYGIRAIGDAKFHVYNSGTIEGRSSFVDRSTMQNLGKILGDIAFDSKGGSLVSNFLENDGAIQGDVSFRATGSLDNGSDGVIHGRIALVANDVLTNDGVISGDIAVSRAGTVHIVNTGAIDGDIVSAAAIVLDDAHGKIAGSVTGSASADSLSGGFYDETFNGGGGTDTLTGRGGDDVLSGAAGNDIIDGGKGDDSLTGGGGTDTFDFSGSFGHDTINDFVATGSGHDIVHFAHNDFANFAKLSAHMAQVGNDIVITLDASDSIVLHHVTLSDLTASDFGFG